MRSFLIVAAICVLLPLVLPMGAQAAGMIVVGKEECKCSPLVAQGVAPDTLNKLGHAFGFPSLFRAVDRIAGEVKNMLAQFGAATPAHAAETPSVPPESVVKEKQEKKPKKPTTKRRIKVPPQAK
ncbi:MAG: hypothetical protein FJ118_13235 [Deltaproteobacteria bacterium]|nr:hypothetical protein [Deltaproteobacteria bacterium]